MKKNIKTPQTADSQKRNLTIRFCVAGLLVSILVVMAMTIGSYYQMRAQGVRGYVTHVAKLINNTLEFERAQSAVVYLDEGVDGSLDPLAQTAKDTNTEDVNAVSNSVELGVYWDQIRKITSAQSGAFFDSEMNLLWTSHDNTSLSIKERQAFSLLVDEGGQAQCSPSGKLNMAQNITRIVDLHEPKFTSLDAFFGNPLEPISGLIIVCEKNSPSYAVLKLTRSYDTILTYVRQTVSKVFIYILIGDLLLFSILFFNFRSGIKTIEEQEKKLNQQIARLSNLLSINKGMQKSMKTASSRAVELNEQFLRRVGSDLHDGPAQSIGYSILRLNKVNQEETSKSFSQEFHVVREALENSLNEIRGISSGLVLPELETMTLTQALQKVVARHSMNSQTDVSQYYTDLPEQIPLPIKICAYRFVQEGLNNAHRHGQAEKCRVAAQVKDGVLHLSLKDNGIGFRKSHLNTEGGHLGLMGLKDRIESLGGRFSINSELGVGTAIKFSVALYDDY